MKKVWSLIIVMLCLIVSVPVMAAEKTEEPKELGFWFEAQVAGGNRPARLIGSFEKEIVGPLGFYVVAVQESNGYREAYFGPTLKPFEWLTVGVGIGKEHIPEADGEESLDSTRYNAFFSVEYEKIALYGSFENGDGGPWHELRAIYNLTEKFGIGVMDESFRGTGPRIEYNTGHGVQLWGALLHNRDTGENVPVLAVNFSF